MDNIEILVEQIDGSVDVIVSQSITNVEVEVTLEAPPQENVEVIVVPNETSIEVFVTDEVIPQGTGDLHYTHNQPLPSLTWGITHNLGKRPSVTIVDTSGNEVEGDVQHISDNYLIVNFTAGFGGKAYLN